jgi:hypothetical protein
VCLSPLIVPCGASSWTIQSCNTTSEAPSVCVNYLDPCDQGAPSQEFFTHPCRKYANSTFLVKNLVTSFERTSPAPSIERYRLPPTQYAIGIEAAWSSEGSLHCAACDPAEDQPTNVSQLLSVATSSLEYSSNLTTLQIAGLQPDTDYNVYCAAKSAFGSATPFHKVLANALAVSE